MKIRLEIEIDEETKKITQVLKDGTPLKSQEQEYPQGGYWWTIHEYTEEIDSEEVIVGHITLDDNPLF